MAALDDQVAGAAIGVRVRDFYEKHPYPLGLDDLKGYAPTWIVSAGGLKRTSFGQVKPFATTAASSLWAAVRPRPRNMRCGGRTHM